MDIKLFLKEKAAKLVIILLCLASMIFLIVAITSDKWFILKFITNKSPTNIGINKACLEGKCDKFQQIPGKQIYYRFT